MAESFTTQLIQRFQIEQKKNDRSGVYALTQRMLAYHSNRIEGSTLTEKQTASLFDTGTLTSEDALIRAKDVEEMTGHFLMFNEMLKTYKEPLSHELMKRYHYKLKSGVFEDKRLSDRRIQESPKYRIGYYNCTAGRCSRAHDGTAGRI